HLLCTPRRCMPEAPRRWQGNGVRYAPQKRFASGPLPVATSAATPQAGANRWFPWFRSALVAARPPGNEVCVRRNLCQRPDHPCRLLEDLRNLRLGDDQRRGDGKRVAGHADHEIFFMEGAFHRLIAALAHSAGPRGEVDT